LVQGFVERVLTSDPFSFSSCSMVMEASQTNQASFAQSSEGKASLANRARIRVHTVSSALKKVGGSAVVCEHCQKRAQCQKPASSREAARRSKAQFCNSFCNCEHSKMPNSHEVPTAKRVSPASAKSETHDAKVSESTSKAAQAIPSKSVKFADTEQTFSPARDAAGQEHAYPTLLGSPQKRAMQKAAVPQSSKSSQSLLLPPEAIEDTEETSTAKKDTPRSITAASTPNRTPRTVTDAALLKSQLLLEQLEELGLLEDLEAHELDENKSLVKRHDSLTPDSEMSTDVSEAGEQEDDDEQERAESMANVTVPVNMLQMMVEMWQELQDLRSKDTHAEPVPEFMSSMASETVKQSDSPVPPPAPKFISSMASKIVKPSDSPVPPPAPKFISSVASKIVKPLDASSSCSPRAIAETLCMESSLTCSRRTEPSTLRSSFVQAESMAKESSRLLDSRSTAGSKAVEYGLTRSCPTTSMGSCSSNSCASLAQEDVDLLTELRDMLRSALHSAPSTTHIRRILLHEPRCMLLIRSMPVHLLQVISRVQLQQRVIVQAAPVRLAGTNVVHGRQI